MRLTAALTSSLVVLALPALAAAEDTKRTVAVPEHGALEISLPAGWRLSTEPTPEGGSETLKLQPAEGDRFLLLTTAYWVKKENRDAREAATWMRVRIHGQTVEQDVPIEVFKGKRNKVYWFRSTNRSPTPGEHEAMVQGAATVGELMVGFTLMHHPGSLPEREQVLRAIGSARHLP